MHDRGHAQQVAQRPAPWRPFCRLVWACPRPDRPRMDRQSTGSPRPGRVCGNFGVVAAADVSPCACIFLRTVISVCIYLSIYPFHYLHTHTHTARAHAYPNTCKTCMQMAGSLRQTTALCSCHAAVIHTHVSDSSIPYAVWQRASGRARGAFLPWSTPCSALVRALNGLPAYIGSFCSKHSTTQMQ